MSLITSVAPHSWDSARVSYRERSWDATGGCRNVFRLRGVLIPVSCKNARSTYYFVMRHQQ